jgi:hypothetical protein
VELCIDAGSEDSFEDDKEDVSSLGVELSINEGSKDGFEDGCSDGNKDGLLPSWASTSLVSSSASMKCQKTASKMAVSNANGNPHRSHCTSSVCPPKCLD